MEAGTSASEFEFLPYDVDLARCQRYYYKVKANGNTLHFGTALNNSTTIAYGVVFFKQEMRTRPSALEQSGTASDYRIYIPSGAVNCSAVPAYLEASAHSGTSSFTVASGLTSGQSSLIITAAASSVAYLAWSAEL